MGILSLTKPQYERLRKWEGELANFVPESQKFTNESVKKELNNLYKDLTGINTCVKCDLNSNCRRLARAYFRAKLNYINEENNS